MAPSGWAYVGGADFATGSGPTGSLQFRAEPGSQITGSHSLVFYTSSIATPWPGAPNFAKNTLVLSGTLYVSGTISASHMHIRDITEIDATGSTKFGDSADDTHVRTGSMYVYASRTDLEIPSLVVTASSNGTLTRVGVGLPAPSGSLHVQVGVGAGVAPDSAADDVVIASDAALGMSLLTPAGFSQRVYFGSPGDTSHSEWISGQDLGYTIFGTSYAGHKLYLRSSFGATALVLDENQNVTASNGNLIVNNGSVGIGPHTKPPSGSLHVQVGDGAATVPSAFADDFVIASDAAAGMTIITPNDENAYVLLGSPSDDNYSQWIGGYDLGSTIFGTAVAGHSLNLRSGNATTALLLDANQNVTAPAGDLLVTNGSITASADITAHAIYSTHAEFSGSDQQEILKVYSKSNPYILFVTSSGKLAGEVNISISGGAPLNGGFGDNAALTVSGSISASVNVSASQFWGDGKNLTNTGVITAVTNGADNRITTFASADSLNGEANLTFNGSLLTLDGSLTASANISASAYIGTALELGTDTVRRGTLSTVAGGTRNEATADYSVVVGGYDNTATDTYTFVGGGVQNNALESYSAVVCGNGNNAGSNYSIIGAGNSSRIGAFAAKSFIGSGEGNNVASDLGAIAGGYRNVIGYASFKVASRSFIGGGNSNTASAQDCVVVGGAGNHIAWGGHRAFIGGGQRNTASATLAAILGGSGSTVSANGSVAIGSGLLVASTNTIVLGGGTNDGGNHQYNIVAQGALSGTYGMEITGGVTRVSAFQGGYKRVTGGDGTMYPIAQETENIYIIGVSSSLTTNDVTVVLPSASIGAGHQIVIKDEWYGTRTAQYAITASVTSSVGGHGTGDMVEGDDHYYMYGSMASVTLYSDGVGKWFVV